MDSKIRVRGSYTFLSAYLSTASANYEAMTADGGMLTGLISGEISPFKGVAIKLRQSYNSTVWGNIQPVVAEEDWDLFVPTYYENLSILAEVSKTF
jgi:hypothetical protein